MFRQESELVTKALPPQKLERYESVDGIWWSIGRFCRSSRFKFEDIEMNLPFFDDAEIAPVVSLVRESSCLFYAYAVHVHLKLRSHSGVETTMREIHRKMFVLGNPRKVVARIRKDCTKCRRILLKTVELKMSKQRGL